MAELREDQLDTLRHSLGVKNSPKPYRCYFVVAPDDAHALELVASGHMIGPFNSGRVAENLATFLVTPVGAAAAGHELEREDAEMVARLMAKPQSDREDG